MAKYRILVRDGDSETEVKQKADGYSIHPGGYHLFAKKGRIVRAISSAKVLEVREA